MYVCVGGYVHVSAGAYGDQRKASDPPELELEVDAGNQPWSSARDIHAFNDGAISPALTEYTSY